ncbi:aldose 1-epimerase [Ascobolus immersus RN42]|uniref:Glucose-6-phosphate 1-epimerase n=1 Tax=Ascobolus immersus RN42 TaxID=1160509 RepID=A0A3N4HE72_ASCIM|nr:aldose 1-epimerase [Ascobolus immersus RN42]
MVSKKTPLSIPVPSAGEVRSAKGSVDLSSDRVRVTLKTGESIEVLLYGATVTSWKVDGEEKLWVSEAAKLDGTKPVRGGIPLVFPCFGPNSSALNLPQHGFARLSNWSFLGENSEEPSSVQVDFGLSPSNIPDELKGKWDQNFGLIYSVILGQKTLQTKLVVQNEGEEKWEFQVLFHTYFKVSNAEKVSIKGLKDVTYTDKVLGGTTASEDNESVTITGETDRVYAKVPTDRETVIEQDGKAVFSVKRKNLEDVVVWNPHAAGAEKIGDFEPKEGWKEMVCVEAGSVGEWTTIEGGSVWEGGQIITLA